MAYGFFETSLSLRWHGVLFTALALTCSGCVQHYAIKAGQPTATLLSHMDNDSTQVFNSNYYTTAYDDESCKGQGRLQTKVLAGRSSTSQSVPIRADSPLLVSMTYMEGRFGQLRSCIATAKFTPQVDRSYKADLHVRDNTVTCGMDVLDITNGTEASTSYTLPEHACAEGIGQIPGNGKAIWTNIKVEVQTR